MDDEHEGDGICVSQSIENQDGLHGKMPRTSAIGGGHNHRDASHDEADPNPSSLLPHMETFVVFSTYLPTIDLKH